jgi:CRP/FNR family transcriptional regulator, cyclic AMP receptor protein
LRSRILTLRGRLENKNVAKFFAVKIARHANVYTCGDQDEMVYFIESGQVKLPMLSSEGKECLLAIHSAGDVFGELCLFWLRRAS